MDVTIKIKNVCWFYTSNKKHESEWVFEESLAIAYLLATEIIFSNQPWWDETLTSEQQQLTSLAVLCNDTFIWGCADAETLPYEELETLWNYYIKDPHWGSTVWCLIQRKEMPQKPVYDLIQKAGIWNLDKIKGLKPNGYDKYCKEETVKRKLKKRYKDVKMALTEADLQRCINQIKGEPQAQDLIEIRKIVQTDINLTIAPCFINFIKDNADLLLAENNSTMTTFKEHCANEKSS